MSYKEVTRKFLSTYAILLRDDRKLSQEKMSEQLRISWRSYSDLEQEINCFSSTSLLFLLLMMKPEEVNALLADFRGRIRKLEEPETF